MTTSPGRTTLLEELDSRQNEVLDQLDQLDRQLQDLLKNVTVTRDAEPETVEG